MESNQLQNSKKIISSLTPNVLGVLWITKEKLSLDLPGFVELNYLFDGLISQYLYGQDEDKHPVQKHTFFTNNFNNSVFLVHTQVNDQTLDSLTKHLDQIPKGHTEARKKILIIQENGLDWSTELQKHYSEFNFQKIEL